MSAPTVTNDQRPSFPHVCLPRALRVHVQRQQVVFVNGCIDGGACTPWALKVGAVLGCVFRSGRENDTL